MFLIGKEVSQSAIAGKSLKRRKNWPIGKSLAQRNVEKNRIANKETLHQQGECS
jgi:hypothetical protein